MTSILVEDRDVGRRGELQTPIPVRDHPEARGVSVVLDTAVVEGAHHFVCVVGRGVVHDDELELREGLAQYAFDASPKILRTVIRRDGDTDSVTGALPGDRVARPGSLRRSLLGSSLWLRGRLAPHLWQGSRWAPSPHSFPGVDEDHPGPRFCAPGRWLPRATARRALASSPRERRRFVAAAPSCPSPASRRGTWYMTASPWRACAPRPPGS